MSSHRPHIYVYGTGLRGDGYPNAWNTISSLKNSGWELEDKVHWLKNGIHLWKITKGPIHQRMSVILKLVFISFWHFLILLSKNNKGKIIYIPYPSIFLLWWISWLPRKIKPFCISDAYISIWDSMFRDRQHAESRILSTLLKRIEMRALRAASCVLTDTEENADQISKDFFIDRNKLFSIPLAIDEAKFLRITSARTKNPLRVLFIGTMIPLHGIHIILGAISALKDHSGIKFHVIGEGQMSDEVAKLVNQLDINYVKWTRGWQDFSSLAHAIGESDVCLGVFGGTGKASRVLALKIYMALAAGRTVVSQNRFGLPYGIKNPPGIYIEPNIEQLTATLIKLYSNPSKIKNTGMQGRDFYNANLSNAAVVRAWEKMISTVFYQEN